MCTAREDCLVAVTPPWPPRTQNSNPRVGYFQENMVGVGIQPAWDHHLCEVVLPGGVYGFQLVLPACERLGLLPLRTPGLHDLLVRLGSERQRPGAMLQFYGGQISAPRLDAAGYAVHPVDHRCGACSMAATLACAACGGVHYCSRGCQKAHWGAHKAVCMKKKA